MHIFSKRIGILVVALVLTGCISSMNDKKGEGGTRMDGTTCKNGVCSHAVSDEGAAPEATYKHDYPDLNKMKHPTL